MMLRYHLSPNGGGLAKTSLNGGQASVTSASGSGTRKFNHL